MRQTSRAVALLLALESARATTATATTVVTGYQDFAAAWNGANPVYGATTVSAGATNLSNRQGAYQVEFPATWSWGSVSLQTAKTVDAKDMTGSTW
jgi:hypothetical protein